MDRVIARRVWLEFRARPRGESLTELLEGFAAERLGAGDGVDGLVALWVATAGLDHVASLQRALAWGPVDSPAHPTRRVLAVLAVLAEFAGEAGRGAIVGLVEAVVAGWSEARQVAAMVELLPWMTDAARSVWLARGLAGAHDDAVVGALVAWLPAEQAPAALSDRLAAARVIAGADARWTALADLVRKLPDEAGAQILRREFALDADPHAIAVFPRWAMDAGLHRARVEHELQHPYRPYTAWLLGMYCRDLPEAARGVVLDRAIEEFAAIAGAPTSPGNDAGPFVDMADLLSEAQVRRALEVVARMDAAPWGPDLEASRQHLAVRLAVLGFVAEAEASIRATREPAWALGTLAGALLARGTGWDGVVGLVTEPVYEWWIGVTWAMSAEQRARRGDVADGMIGLLPRVAADDGKDALESLVVNFATALPVARLVAVVRAWPVPADRVAPLLELARATGDAAVAGEAVALLADGDLGDVLDELCAIGPLLAVDVRAGLVRRMLVGGSGRVLREDALIREIAALLTSMGGEDALVAAARGLLAIDALLD